MIERYNIPLDVKAERCKGKACGLPIYFVATNPDKPNRKIPLNHDGTPHWRSCVNANDFRKSRQSPNLGNRR